MATDWIKMRTCLARDGRVAKTSRTLATNVPHICGALYVMWSLADELAVEDVTGGAILEGYNEADLDRSVGIPGFTEALPRCWMEVRPEGLYLPKYIEHNGSTGKKRAQDQKRQRKVRQKCRKTVTLSSDEKATRIDKNRNKGSRPPAPTKQVARIREDDPHVVGFVAAYDQQFPEPYELEPLDLVGLARWKKTHGSITPERFVEIATIQWDRGEYAFGASLTIAGMARDWRKLVGSAKQLQQAPKHRAKAVPPEALLEQNALSIIEMQDDGTYETRMSEASRKLVEKDEPLQAKIAELRGPHE